MPHICECPHPGHTESIQGDAQQNQMNPTQDQDIENPKSTAVHVVGIRVGIPVTPGHHSNNAGGAAAEGSKSSLLCCGRHSYTATTNIGSKCSRSVGWMTAAAIDPRNLSKLVSPSLAATATAAAAAVSSRPTTG